MVKGQIDAPGKELRSKCSQPETLNRFCGILPEGHDAWRCCRLAEKRGDVLRRMREAVKKLDHMKQCDQWDTRPTFNNTPGPYRFGLYQNKGKPWSVGRVKSAELIGGQLYRNCECIRKNGLQDDCPRSQCRGRAWCLENPLPLCPPFTKLPVAPCQPDPYCAHQQDPILCGGNGV